MLFVFGAALTASVSVQATRSLTPPPKHQPESTDEPKPASKQDHRCVELVENADAAADVAFIAAEEAGVEPTSEELRDLATVASDAADDAAWSVTEAACEVSALGI